jgi:hypothetical protein
MPAAPCTGIVVFGNKHSAELTRSMGEGWAGLCAALDGAYPEMGFDVNFGDRNAFWAAVVEAKLPVAAVRQALVKAGKNATAMQLDRV